MAEPLRPALAVSALVHAAVFALAVLLTLHRASTHAPHESGASFPGDTYDLDDVLEAQKREASAPAAAPAAPAGAAAAVAPDPGAVAVPRRSRARAKKPAPAASASATGPAVGPVGAASAAAPAGEPPGSSSAGTSGEATGVANIAKAFAKAVSAASHKDPTWDELPLGAAGALRVVITIDEEGRIEQGRVSQRDEQPTHLVKLVDRTLLLLRAGRFALSKSEAKSGSETLRVEVTLSSVQHQEDFEDPRHTVAMGFDPPRPARPGRAYFVHAAGRRFDAKISIE